MAATDPRTRARRAIQELATQLNLPTDLTVLSERWNTVARLGDSDVIAKSATLAHLSRHDPLHWFRQDVRVSTELANVGAPVHMPKNGLQSCYVIDNLPITLWQRIDGVTAGSPEMEMVDSLAELHRLGAGIELEQPWFATMTVEAPGTLSMLADRRVLSPAQEGTLHSYLDRLLDAIDSANLPGGFIHGDAQRKNSLHAANGTIWIDLEETCIGPLAWDLACLTMNPIFDPGRVLDRYAHVSGTDRVSLGHLRVLQQLRKIEGLVWMLAIQHELEEEFRQETLSQLARLLQVASAG